MKILIILMVLLSFSVNANAFTEAQKKILDIAYVEGLKIGYPETIQAISLQETIAGRLHLIGDRNQAFGKKSYGIMQVKIATAIDVIRWYPTIKNEYPFLASYRFSDEELLVKLITDTRFNIRVGTLYFKKMVDRFKNSKKPWGRAVLAYIDILPALKYRDSLTHELCGSRLLLRRVSFDPLHSL